MTEPGRMVPIEEALITWMSVMEPHIARFEVAAKFGQTACYNSIGSAAMASLIRKMATLLDEEAGTRAANAARALRSSGTTEVPER